MAVVILATACRGSEGTGTDDGVHVDCTLLAVSLSPSTATLRPGDTLLVTATRHFCGAPTTTRFRWLSGNTLVADVDSLSGLVRARDVGTTAIIVTDANEPTLKAAMSLRVER